LRTRESNAVPDRPMFQDKTRDLQIFAACKVNDAYVNFISLKHVNRLAH